MGCDPVASGEASLAEALAKRARKAGGAEVAGTSGVAASLMLPGGGAGSSWRSVAARMRSSEPSISTPDIINAHPCGAAIVEIQQMRGLGGHVDKALAMIGPAVVDAHDQRAAVSEVGHACVARQRQRRMRRRDAVAVKDFAIGGQAAVKVVAVPRRQTLGVIARVFFRNVDAAGDRIGRTDSIDAAAFGDRLAVSDDPRTGATP